MNRTRIEISSWSIVKLVLILLGFYFIYTVRDIIALFAIVLILVATFSSTVENWSKKITRPGAVVALMLIIVSVILAVIWLVFPPLVNQSAQLIQNIPDYFKNIDFVKNNIPQIKSSLSSLSGQLGNISSSLINITTGIFGGIVSIITVMVLFVYLLLDKNDVKNTFLSVVPEDKRNIAGDLFRKVAQKAGSWFRGQMLLGFIIGCIDLLGLLIIGVPYALTLAVISALLEIIPTIGPIISGALAALIALSVSPIKAVIVVIMYIVVQQLENTLIVPKIMEKAVGLSPIVIIFAILIGAKLYGILGIILAIPLTASLMVVAQEWPAIKRSLNNEQ